MAVSAFDLQMALAVRSGPVMSLGTKGGPGGTEPNAPGLIVLRTAE